MRRNQCRVFAMLAILVTALTACGSEDPLPPATPPGEGEVHAQLAAHTAEFQKRVYQVTDGVHVAVGFGLANSIMVEGDECVVIVDVMVVASGFVLRVAAGVIVAEAERFSPWLYVCTIFLALFLVIGRRRHELTLLAEGANSHRKILDQYTVQFLDEMSHLVTTGAIISYSLYTFSAENLPDNHAMMLTIPFVIYGFFRYLYLVHVKGEGGAPEMLLYTDLPFLLNLILCGVAVVLVMYVFNP